MPELPYGEQEQREWAAMDPAQRRKIRKGLPMPAPTRPEEPGIRESPTLEIPGMFEAKEKAKQDAALLGVSPVALQVVDLLVPDEVSGYRWDKLLEGKPKEVLKKMFGKLPVPDEKMNVSSVLAKSKAFGDGSAEAEMLKKPATRGYKYGMSFGKGRHDTDTKRLVNKGDQVEHGTMVKDRVQEPTFTPNTAAQEEYRAASQARLDAKKKQREIDRAAAFKRAGLKVPD